MYMYVARDTLTQAAGEFSNGGKKNKDTALISYLNNFHSIHCRAPKSDLSLKKKSENQSLAVLTNFHQKLQHLFHTHLGVSLFVVLVFYVVY